MIAERRSTWSTRQCIQCYNPDRNNAIRCILQFHQLYTGQVPDTHLSAVTINHFSLQVIKPGQILLCHEI